MHCTVRALLSSGSNRGGLLGQRVTGMGCGVGTPAGVSYP